MSNLIHNIDDMLRVYISGYSFVKDDIAYRMRIVWFSSADCGTIIWIHAIRIVHIVHLWCVRFLLQYSWLLFDFTHMFQGNICHRVRFMGQTWGPPGSCRPQMGPMLAPWTLLSGCCWLWLKSVCNSPGTATLADVGGMDRYLTIAKDHDDVIKWKLFPLY